MYRKLIVLALVVALSWATQIGNDDNSDKNDGLDSPEITEETIFAAGSNDPTENDDDSFNNDALDFAEVTEATIFAAGSNDPTENDDDSLNNSALDLDEVTEETILTGSMSTTRKPIFKVNPEAVEEIKNFFSNAVHKIAKWFG